jgi:hypothetical protein
MAMFTEFRAGKLPLYSLNFGAIILLSKCREASQIKQYRPICLLIVSFNFFFTKVATNRISQVAQNVISPSQTDFVLGHNIMEGVIVLHETLLEIHRKKQSGVIMKIDFEKAYDKLNWNFIQHTLRMKGFLPIWCKYVASFMEGGLVNVKVNDLVGQNF